MPPSFYCKVIIGTCPPKLGKWPKMLLIDHSCTLNAPLKFYASSVTNDTIVARDNGRWSVVCLCNTCYQELTMVRELIPHIGFIPKVIRVKLFLDMVPTSSVNISRRICLCFLYKAKENLQRCEDAFFDISISKKAKKQGKIHESWSFDAFVLWRTAKKCTKY